MQVCVQLLTVCFLPALAGILVTRPMWRIRTLPNEAIQGIALVILIGVLTVCLVPLFFQECTAAGGLSLLLSLFNLVLFQRYERWLNTSRCPRCHIRSLRIHRCGKGLYKLYCPHCGLHNRWYSWRYAPEER